MKAALGLQSRCASLKLMGKDRRQRGKGLRSWPEDCCVAGAEADSPAHSREGATEALLMVYDPATELLPT